MDVEGLEHAVDLAEVDNIDLENSRYIRIYKQAELLGFCDLIDMPGISDPNMSPEVWQRMLHHADAIVWCTHATQAWRQSEAAVWDTIPQAMQARSLLLLTRFDKITTPSDRRRVVRRVARETNGKFADIFPISLTNALAAGDDRAAWEKSGAEAFVEALVELLHDLGSTLGTDFEKPDQADNETAPPQTGFAAAVQNRRAPPQLSLVQPSRVAPRRISPSPERPQR